MKKKKNASLWGEIFSWCKYIAAALAVALFINNAVIVNAVVPSGSMADTISIGDRIIGSRLAYVFSPPARGDVILFSFPDNESEQYIKRIVGLPGETIRIVEGRVYVDEAEEPLEEPYLMEPPLGSFGPFSVPDECYFVLGDNRNDSYDSRFWEHPYVRRNQIRAKADFCYYPHPYSFDNN